MPMSMRVGDNEGLMADDTTTITISRETWKELHMRKDLGESFDDVVDDLLEKAKKYEELGEESK